MPPWRSFVQRMPTTTVCGRRVHEHTPGMNLPIGMYWRIRIVDADGKDIT